MRTCFQSHMEATVFITLQIFFATRALMEIGNVYSHKIVEKFQKIEAFMLVLRFKFIKGK